MYKKWGRLMIKAGPLWLPMVGWELRKWSVAVNMGRWGFMIAIEHPDGCECNQCLPF